MSETPLPSAGSSDFETVDNTIQRKWDEFAMPDLFVDSALQRPLAPTSSGSTDSPLSPKAFESVSAYGFRTALGDAFARAEMIDSADREFDAPDDRGAF